MIWYFVLALFWTSVILYIIGLVVGIIKFEHNDTKIQFEEKQVKEHSAQQERQRENDYEQPASINM